MLLCGPGLKRQDDAAPYCSAAGRISLRRFWTAHGKQHDLFVSRSESDVGQALCISVGRSKSRRCIDLHKSHERYTVESQGIT